MELVLDASTRSCFLLLTYSALSIDTLSPDEDGLTLIVSHFVIPPADAVISDQWPEPLTGMVEIVKLALVAPAGTVTLSGTVATQERQGGRPPADELRRRILHRPTYLNEDRNIEIALVLPHPDVPLQLAAPDDLAAPGSPMEASSIGSARGGTRTETTSPSECLELVVRVAWMQPPPPPNRPSVALFLVPP